MNNELFAFLLANMFFGTDDFAQRRNRLRVGQVSAKGGPCKLVLPLPQNISARYANKYAYEFFIAEENFNMN